VNSAGNRAGVVLLTDENGKFVSGRSLADGAEVEVVAWKPRVAGEAHYRVRGANGLDGWLPAESLRMTPEPPAPTPPTSVPVTPVTDPDARRLGQRSFGNSAPRRYAPSVSPPLGDDGARRRFGQIFDPKTSAEAPPAPEVDDRASRRFGQR
jgi:hypothetical protein